MQHVYFIFVDFSEKLEATSTPPIDDHTFISAKNASIGTRLTIFPNCKLVQITLLFTDGLSCMY